MRTYLILKDKATQFATHPGIQALLQEIRGGREDIAPAFSAASADSLKARTFDRQALAARPLPYERLDQLVVDLLLGVA